MSKDIRLANFIVGPGEKKNFFLKAGELADGSAVNIPVMVVNGSMPGPKLLVVAATHGDEVAGTEAAKSIASQMDPDKIRGALITIPVLNVVSYLLVDRINSLEVPAGRNEMGRFIKEEGDRNGTQTQQIVHMFHEHILPNADYYVELHSSAKWGLNYPRVLIAPEWAPIKSEIKEKEKKMALASGFEVIFRSRQKSWSGKYAPLDASFQEKWGIPRVVLESGAAPTLIDAEIFEAAIRNIMRHLGLTEGAMEPSRPADREQVFVDKLIAIRASKGGILRMKKDILGQYLIKGEVLGEVTNLFNETVEELKSPDDGLVLKIATSATCYTGSRAAVIATPYA